MYFTLLLFYRMPPICCTTVQRILLLRTRHSWARQPKMLATDFQLTGSFLFVRVPKVRYFSISYHKSNDNLGNNWNKSGRVISKVLVDSGDILDSCAMFALDPPVIFALIIYCHSDFTTFNNVVSHSRINQSTNHSVNQ